MSHGIRFLRSGRGKAQNPPDPKYPNGVALNMSKPGQDFCDVMLPYPAPECGMHEILCSECGLSVLVSAAGRNDDPVSVRVACKKVIQ